MRQRIADRVTISERLRVNRLPSEILAHADEDDPLTHLRHAEPLGVEQPGLYAIAGIFQGSQHFENQPFAVPLTRPLTFSATNVLG